MQSPIAIVEKETAVEEQASAMGMQTEIPYVPTQQRKTREVVEDSSIVVVGQARQKKRKRTKSAQQIEDGGSKNADKARASENLESAKPFDFSRVPNILDEVQEEDRAPVKKKKGGNEKGSKGAWLITDNKILHCRLTSSTVKQPHDFPAPPKAHSELRSGNKTLTFR